MTCRDCNRPHSSDTCEMAQEIARLEVCCKVKDEELEDVRLELKQTESALHQAHKGQPVNWYEHEIARLKARIEKMDDWRGKYETIQKELAKKSEELNLTVMRNSALQDLFVRVQRSLARGTPAGKLSAQLQAMLQQVDWHGPEGDILRFAIERMDSLEDFGPEKPREDQDSKG